MDPRDRIVDYALERLLSESPQVDLDVDLAGEVRRSWERGIPGPSIDDLDWSDIDFKRVASAAREIRSAQRREQHRWVTRAYGVVALAALVLAVLFVWAIRGAESSTYVVAELSRTLPELQDGTWRAGATQTLRRGQVAWVDGTTPVTVTLPDGGSLIVDPGTLFELDRSRDGRTSVNLEWGSLVAQAIEHPIEIAAGATSAELAPGTRVEARLAWDRSTPPANSLHTIEGTRTRLGRVGALGTLGLSVVEGSAELSVGAERSTLIAGEEQSVALEKRGPRLLPTDDGDLVRQSLEALVAELSEAGIWSATTERSFEELGALLRAEPTRWIHLREPLRRHLADSKLPRLAREGIIGQMAMSGGRVAQEIALEVWESHPSWFRVHAILAFAEQDVAAFRREVLAIVQNYDPSAKGVWVDDADLIDPLLPSVFLALRGDKSVRDLGAMHITSALRDVAPTKYGPQNSDLVQRIAASIAMEALDSANPAWRTNAESLEAATRKALERRDFEAAVGSVLMWEFFVEARRAGVETMPISYLSDRVQRYVFAHEAELATDEDVEERIETLRSL